MAGRNDGDRISTVRRANGTCRPRITELNGELTVGPSFPIRDSDQHLPDLLLRRRSSHVERYCKRRPLACEVFPELGLRLREDRLLSVLDVIIKRDSPPFLLLPKDSHEPVFTGDQFELLNR